MQFHTNRLSTGTEFAQLSDLLSVDKEKNWNREQSSGKEAQQTHSPWNSKIVEHARRKHGKSSSKPASEESVGRNGRVCVHGVAVDDVVQSLQEDKEDTCSDEASCDDLRHP